MLLRWLLPIVALVALLGNATAVFGAAGTFAMSRCCCPDPTLCQCDHDRSQEPTPALERCAGDTVKVTPHLVAFAMPQVLEHVITMSEHVVVTTIPSITDRFVEPPEPPPF